MSAADDNSSDMESDDLLAAEYVIGVLDNETRQAVSGRIDSEPAFARLVDGWAARLSPLEAAYAPVEPPATVKAALDARLFAAAAAAPSTGFWSSLAFWRGLAVASLAALAIFVGASMLRGPAPADSQLIASLAADGSDVHYLAVYDTARGEVGLSHVTGARATGRDFELWMIEGSNAPVSMGVIPVGSAARIVVSDANRAKLAAGATLAISLEPAGGSPTGQPTGPVVAAGQLAQI